jgi:cell division protein FtsI/penicillin-binding protein 2
MMFRSHNKEDRNVFGLTDKGPDWLLPDNGDGQVETMALGPERQRTKWASMSSPVLYGRWRLGVFVVLLALGLLAARSAYLQVGQGDYYRGIADANRTRINVIPSHRGIIKDRTGLELAENAPDFRLIVWPQDLPTWPEKLSKDPATREASIRAAIEGAVSAVATELDIPSKPIVDKLAVAAADEQLLLAEDITYEHALAFFSKADEYPGFTVEFAEKRQYYTSAIPTLSHVLGYTGPVNNEEYETLEAKGYRRFDSVGKQGLEAWHEDESRSTLRDELCVWSHVAKLSMDATSPCRSTLVCRPTSKLFLKNV